VTTSHESTDPETSVCEAWDRADFEQAATRLIKCYDPESQGFLGSANASSSRRTACGSSRGTKG
jgi:hypothetical protein